MNKRHCCRLFIKPRRSTLALAVCVLAALSVLPFAATAQTAGAAASLPDENLLSYADGTIVRSYTPGLSGVADIFRGYGLINAGTKGPIQVVYELPGVATLSSLAIAFATADPGAPPVTATIAVSTTSASDGFRDLGSVHSNDSGDPQAIPGVSGVHARWLRVTATVPLPTDSSSIDVPINQIVAHGTLAPRPAKAPSIAGDYWAFGVDLNAAGGLRAKPSGEQDRLVVAQVGDGVVGLQCYEQGYVTSYLGRLSGRIWTFVGRPGPGKFVLNDEGTILAGEAADTTMFFVRTGGAVPSYCAAPQLGTGATGVLVLNGPGRPGNYPFGGGADVLARFKALHFTLVGAPLLTPALLQGTSIVVLNGLCEPQFLLNAQQGAMLMQWVAAGHKLLIQDSDECGGDPAHPTRYDFLPYPFLADTPGARGASGNNLMIVENDTLGTNDKSDKTHFIDAEGYANDASNQLGDANTVVSQDAHWCGHLFGTNADGVNGFMQMYAIYGKGLIIYDGLDLDDAGFASYQAIRRLEYAQPVPADLPCTRHVSAGFVVVPDQSLPFTLGKAEMFSVPLRVFTNRGWKGHVVMTARGPLVATVSPGAFDMPQAARTISVAIAVPASATAVHYAIVVKGSGNDGSTAQATIKLNAAKPTLSATLAKQCKVAVYGINFDFNKATLRPDSGPVLEQVLALFKNDPTLVVEIGGHTDNVGTPAYNLELSQRRADSVKTWLVAHGVAASRLTTQGYGDTMPLAPNTINGKDNPAGRAKNRRVELKKPGCNS